MQEKMSETREKIIEILEKMKAATVDELSRKIQVTQADVRHHLTILVRLKVVEKAGVTRSESRGRPQNIYRLAVPARKDNLAGLASSLLRIVNQTGDAAVLLEVAETLASGDSKKGDRPGPPMVAAIQRLNELEYQARWEAHASSPHIILGNCPYRPILDQHPELCTLDALLIKSLTGMEADQAAKLETSPEGALYCLFHLRR
jgi:predicted ArsR family transcriptional regulator